MDDIDKFDEKELPSKEDFYNRLNNENISDENYEDDKNGIFSNEKNLKIFMKYIKKLLLYHQSVDAFENFRQTCLDTFMKLIQVIILQHLDYHSIVY